jgi:hypothetical protein
MEGSDDRVTFDPLVALLRSEIDSHDFGLVVNASNDVLLRLPWEPVEHCLELREQFWVCFRSASVLFSSHVALLLWTCPLED